MRAMRSHMLRDLTDRALLAVRHWTDEAELRRLREEAWLEGVIARMDPRPAMDLPLLPPPGCSGAWCGKDPCVCRDLGTVTDSSANGQNGGTLRDEEITTEYVRLEDRGRSWATLGEITDRIVTDAQARLAMGHGPEDLLLAAAQDAVRVWGDTVPEHADVLEAWEALRDAVAACVKPAQTGWPERPEWDGVATWVRGRVVTESVDPPANPGVAPSAPDRRRGSRRR